MFLCFAGGKGGYNNNEMTFMRPMKCHVNSLISRVSSRLKIVRSIFVLRLSPVLSSDGVT